MPVHSSHLLSYHDLKLGKRIREARQRQSSTLQQLAGRSGISPARLSQIENEEHVVDLRQVVAIAGALGVPLDSLLPPDRCIPYQVTREGQIHTRPPRESRVYGRSGDAATRNLFWPLADMFVGRQMEPMTAHIMPGDPEDLQVCYHHDQEFAFVLKGAIEFLIETPDGRRREELAPGDCIYFRSHLPHSLRSLRSDPSESLHIFSSASTPLPTALEWLRLDDNGQGTGAAADGLVGGEFAFFRAAQGWTFKSMAQLVGLNERHVRKIEEGKRGVRFDTMMTFARAFGKPLRDFMRGGRPPQPYYFVQRASEIERLPPQHRRHPLQRKGARVSFDHLPLARGFPSRYIYPYLLRVPNVGIETLTAHEHHGQELIYVLDGQIELTTYVEETEVKETLRPGDACYLEASVPHLVRGQSRNPYSQTSASIIVVFWCPLGEQYLFDLATPPPQPGLGATARGSEPQPAGAEAAHRTPTGRE